MRWTSPTDVLQATNDHLLGMNDAGMFVTMLYGVLDCRRAHFTYARAGHELPLQLEPGGSVVVPEYGVGQPLGLFAGPELDGRGLALQPGSALLMHTDGATDLRDEQGERFGPQRLREAARMCWERSTQAFCERLWTTLAAYQGSVAAIRRRGPDRHPGIVIQEELRI